MKVLAPDCVNEPAPSEKSYATNYDSTEVGALNGEDGSGAESQSDDFSDEDNDHDESAAALDGTDASLNPKP